MSSVRGPFTLARVLLALFALIALVIVATFALVVASARELERATSPLIVATDVRHTVLEAEGRCITALVLPRRRVPATRLDAVAARERAERCLDELIAESRRETVPQPVVDDLLASWRERCARADLVFEAALERPEDEEVPAKIASYEEASHAFYEKLQRIISLLEARAQRLVVRFKVTAAVIAGAGLLLLALGTGLVLRSLVFPLRRLVDAESNVARGKLDISMPTGGVAEVRALAIGFNEMVGALRGRERALAEKQALVVRRERALDLRNRELAAANVELDAFAYAASHDLRAPLRGIESMARFLWEDAGDKLDAEARDRLERIRRAARRLHQLIDSLLEVARAGRELGPIEDVPLGECVALAVEALEGPIRDAGAVVVVQAGLPSARGDRTRLAQVLQNLIGNAVKYSSGRGRSAHVEVGGRVLEPDGIVEVWVEDNGIGIAEDQHRRIFQLFRRLHREGDYEGAGVGLSIVDRIVRAHGGSVVVDSAPGKGARFTVRLPQRAASQAREAA